MRYRHHKYQESTKKTYSGLQWDCLRVLIHLPDLQDFCAVFLQGWATDNGNSITLCFSSSRICNIFSWSFHLSNIRCVLFFNRNVFQIFMFQYLRVWCKCSSTCYCFFVVFLKIACLFIVCIAKSKHRFCESLWDLNWAVLRINKR